MPQLSGTKKLSDRDQEVLLKALAYDGIKKQEKELKAEIKDKGDELRNALSEEGIIDPNTGSIHIEGNYLGKYVHVMHQARKSVSMVPEVEEILETNLNEEDFDFLFENVRVLRDDRLEQLVTEGKISEELLARISNVKTSYALKVSVKKAI